MYIIWCLIQDIPINTICIYKFIILEAKRIFFFGNQKKKFSTNLYLQHFSFLLKAFVILPNKIITTIMIQYLILFHILIKKLWMYFKIKLKPFKEQILLEETIKNQKEQFI